MQQPIWTDPGLANLFTNTIVRSRTMAHLWHPTLAPLPRLFLLFGQKGSGMEACVMRLIEQHGVDFAEWLITPFAKVTQAGLANLQGQRGELLVIRHGEHLPAHPDLFPVAFNLNAALDGFKFVLVISQQYPQSNAFWDQFKHRMLMSLPTREFSRSLLAYYFTAWAAHWTTSKMCLSDEDLDHLAVFAAFCTPRDIKLFARTVFTHVIDHNVDITRDLLEERFLHNTTGIEGVYSLTKDDHGQTQREYAGAAGLGLATQDLADGPRKRAKLDPL